MARIFFITLLTSTVFSFCNVQAQSVAHDRCQSLEKGINVSNWLEEYWNTDWPNPTKYTKQHFEVMKDAGFKSVRLPINFHAVVDTIAPYDVDTAHLVFDLVDSVVEWTDDLEMKLLIDNHHGWDLLDDSWRADLPRFSHMWGVVAERYQHLDPDRVMFELMNEPKLGFSGDSLAVMYEDAIDSIRQHSTDHSIIISPPWTGIAMMFAEFEPIEGDTNLIYTWHTYDPLNFTHQGLTWHNPYYPSGTPFSTDAPSFTETWSYVGWERALDWKETHQLPMFLGEFGLSTHCDSVSTCNWLEYNMTKLVQNDFSWFYWDWQWDFSMFQSNTISEDSIYPCFKHYLGLYGDDTFTEVAEQYVDPFSFSIYPNPSADGNFILQLNEASYNDLNIAVLTNLGELVYQDFLVDNRFESRQSLAPGIYMVVLFSEENRMVKKLVVN